MTTNKILKHCQFCREEMIIIPSLAKSKKYCSRSCHREWRKKQAEYWKIHTDELKTLLKDTCIEDYDKYILADELVCPFKSCNWTGQALPSHCLSQHGVDIYTLKKVLGFNKTTGMVTKKVSQKMAETAVKILERDGRNSVEYMKNLREHPGFKENNNKFDRRDECKTHSRISQKLRRRKNFKEIVCEYCGVEFTPVFKTYGKQRKYCTEKCMWNAGYHRTK